VLLKAGAGIEPAWRRQERAFDLFKKVYAKRAAIRGQQTLTVLTWQQGAQDWPSAGDDYFE
jgi:hypothetical protein